MIEYAISRSPTPDHPPHRFATYPLLFLGSVAGYLIDSPLQYLAALTPPFWVTEAFLASYSQGPAYWYYLT